MPRQIVTVRPVGNIDRLSNPSQGSVADVLWRENFTVLGVDVETRKNKKMAGADRFNATAVGTTFASGKRYYTKKGVRRTFAYNTDGYIYYFDENGNTTQLVGVFSSLARPCWQIIRVSGNDVLFFSEGVSTGLYQYDGNLSNEFQHVPTVSLNFVDMTSWLDRLWGFEEDDEAVNFSVNLEPTDFTDSTDAGTIIIGAKAGSKIQRIAVHQDTLYIFKSDSIWRINGRSPSEFYVEVVHDKLGVAARWSLQQVENGFIFLGSDYEWYAFGGNEASTTKLTYKIAMAGDLTKDLPAIINKNKMDNVASVYHNNLYRCSFVEHGANTPNMEYIYNAINKTDSFSRGFNISCYLHYDQVPDKNELFTGRFGEGRLMRMYSGNNCDNGATNPSMPIRLQSMFNGQKEPRNIRIKKIWGTFGVLTAPPIGINLYRDCRTRLSQATTDELTPYGESVTIYGMGSMASQSAITDTFVPRWGNSKCQNFSLEIRDSVPNRELELSHFDVETIYTKNLKMSRKVGQ